MMSRWRVDIWYNIYNFGDIALNEGMLTENVVAQMLTAAGRKLYLSVLFVYGV